MGGQHRPGRAAEGPAFVGGVRVATDLALEPRRLSTLLSVSPVNRNHKNALLCTADGAIFDAQL